MPTPSNHARLHEVDWLRIGAVFLIFLVHVSQVFSPLEEWHIDSPDKSPVLEQFTVFVGPWIIPLFMLLAGASAWFSRKGRSDGEYLRVRVARILVPLVAGTLLLIPIQMYYFRMFRGEFEGTFLSFYPHFFEGVYPEGNFNWGHLWFLAYLFTYMLAGLPLFRLLDRESGKRVLDRISRWMTRPGGILLPALPLVFGQWIFRVPFTATTGALVGDWATHAWLFPIFLYGYLLMAEGRMMESVDRQWKGTLALALPLSLGLAIWSLPGDAVGRLPGTPGTEYFLFWGAFALASWSWLMVILGAARTHLRHEGPVLRWARALVYPFYIFHQPIIVVVAYYMVTVPVTLWLRLTLVGLLSFVATLAALELTRRIPGIRTLFGLQPRLRAPGM